MGRVNDGTSKQCLVMGVCREVFFERKDAKAQRVLL